MKKLLSLFVGVACFACEHSFGVPFSWESCGDAYKISHMEAPSTVCPALCKCKVVEDNGLDCVEIVNSDGDSICCNVSGSMVRPGECLLGFDYNAKPLGEVFFVEGDRLEVAQVGSQSVFYEPDPFYVLPNLLRRRYYAGKECFTVKRFFGVKGESLGCEREVFVRATIYYNDLKKVVIRCGWDDDPEYPGECIRKLTAVSDKAEAA